MGKAEDYATLYPEQACWFHPKDQAFYRPATFQKIFFCDGSMKPKDLQMFLRLPEEPVMKDAVLVETHFDYKAWGGRIVGLHAHSAEVIPGKIYNVPPAPDEPIYVPLLKFLLGTKGYFVFMLCPVRADGEDSPTNIWSVVWSGPYSNYTGKWVTLTMNPTKPHVNTQSGSRSVLQHRKPRRQDRPRILEQQREIAELTRDIGEWTREILFETRKPKLNEYTGNIKETWEGLWQEWEDIKWADRKTGTKERAMRPWHVPLRPGTAGMLRHNIEELWRGHKTFWDVLDEIVQAIFRPANQRFELKLPVLGTAIVVSLRRSAMSPIRYPEQVCWFYLSNEAYFSFCPQTFFCDGSMDLKDLCNLLSLPEEPILKDAVLIETDFEYTAWGDSIVSLHVDSIETLPGKVYAPPEFISWKHVALLKLHMNAQFTLAPCPVRLGGETSVSNMWSFVRFGPQGKAGHGDLVTRTNHLKKPQLKTEGTSCSLSQQRNFVRQMAREEDEIVNITRKMAERTSEMIREIRAITCGKWWNTVETNRIEALERLSCRWDIGVIRNRQDSRDEPTHEHERTSWDLLKGIAQAIITPANQEFELKLPVLGASVVTSLRPI